MKDLGQADKICVDVESGGRFFGWDSFVHGSKLGEIKQTSGHKLRIEFAKQLAQRQAGGAAIVVRNSLRRSLKRIRHYVCHDERARLAQSVESKATLEIVLPEHGAAGDVDGIAVTVNEFL